MNTYTKTLVGTVAAGALAVSTATPALARDHDGGIDAGTVIAGALVLGGIAAVAASADNHSRYDVRYNGYDRGYDRYDGRYGNYDYRRGVNPRSAVEQCVRAATRAANRYSYGGRAKVTDIRDVDRRGYGYKVEGRIAVNTMQRGWRSGDRYYGNGWGNDYRGFSRNLRGYDAGRFTCKVDYRGGVRDLDFQGIRGL